VQVNSNASLQNEDSVTASSSSEKMLELWKGAGVFSMFLEPGCATHVVIWVMISLKSVVAR
jgi:hypothetical protein